MLQLIMMHHSTKLVTKCLVVLQISSGHSVHTFTDIVNLCCDLDLDSEDSKPSFFSLSFKRHSRLWWCLADQVWLPKSQKFKRYSRKSHVLITWALAVTLTLKIANQSFYMTLWLIMMPHTTKFENKMFGGLKDISWTNINILTFHCDLDSECNDSVFSQVILVYDNVSSDQVW